VARVVRQGEAKQLHLPGRNSVEIVSAEAGSRSVTLRRVEIPASSTDSPPRALHRHNSFEECIFVLSGRGTTHTAGGEYELVAGDTILIPPGEAHATRNTGTDRLVLLCFFPVGNVAQDTYEPATGHGMGQ
jgi:quercetin dioxygenase-like cupin family protein